MTGLKYVYSRDIYVQLSQIALKHLCRHKEISSWAWSVDVGIGNKFKNTMLRNYYNYRNFS